MPLIKDSPIHFTTLSSKIDYVMAKKPSDKEMERIEAILQEQHAVNVHQEKLLNEILLCLKGSEAMNIEGVMPAQRRIEETLNEINKWKKEVTLYLGIITSKKVWRFIIYFLAAIAGVILTVKYGFQNAWKYIKDIL